MRVLLLGDCLLGRGKNTDYSNWMDCTDFFRWINFYGLRYLTGVTFGSVG